MDRNTSTTVYHLKIGDRFYKANDKKKAIYELVPGEVKKTYYQTYRYFALKDGEISPVPIKYDTQVIFLRHKENISHEKSTAEEATTLHIENEKRTSHAD